MIENVKTTRLSNGVTVATDAVSTVESISLGVWVAAGARHETPEINGVSHLLEHMAFKGTERRSAQAIAEEIEAVGGFLNAYTSRDNTAYYARVLKADRNLALDILSDILHNSVFDAEELQREREVVVQEILQAIDTPDDIIFDYFQETAYPGQALGRPVLGTAEVVRSLDRNAVKGYLRDSYSADRMVVSASGPIDHDDFVKAVSAQFGGFPEASPLDTEPARFQSGGFREERDLEQVHVVVGFEGVPYHDDDYYAASVLSTLHGGGMSSRLFQEIREKRGLVYSIYSYASSFHDSGIYGVYAGTGETEVKELIPVLCDETVRLADTLSEAEVDRAKTQIKAGILMSMESTSSRAEHLARQIQIYGRAIPTDEIVAKLDAIDVPTVAAVARRIFTTKPVTAVIGPLANVESHEQIAQRLKG